jgi:hypothetical protein
LIRRRESSIFAHARKVGDGVIALHDRLIPGTRGNIDHIFVAPTGVWVVDSKAYQGKVVQREVGPLWWRDNELYIRGTAPSRARRWRESRGDST